MSTSQFAVYQLKRKPELRNLLYRTYEELAQEQIPVQVENYEQVYIGTMKPGETPEQVKKNIDQKRPIYVAATSSGNGHAVACFGYKVNNQKKYVYFWNPGTQSTSIVLYKTAGTTFSYNNSVWTWKYTAARNG